MPDDFHVYPLNDLKPHVLEGSGCPCEPEATVEGASLIYKHNAYDKREIIEQAQEVWSVKTGWHATRNPDGIVHDGLVKPIRMQSVYLFSTSKSAVDYAKEFGYDAVVKVEYNDCDVINQWKPKYAGGAKVVRLKPGKTAKFINFV